MPSIPQYDAGSLSLRPSETGVEAVAGTARRVAAFFNQKAGAEETLARETSRLAGETEGLGRETGQLGSEKQAALTSAGRAVGSGIAEAGDIGVKYLDNQQISKGNADWSGMLLQKTQQWNDAVKHADPNDPTVGPKFMQQLQNDLQNFKEGFYTEKGQAFAEAHANALQQHFAEKTIGDMATLAGQAAVVNHQKTINQLSATVHGDPASIDLALAALKSSTEGVISTSPNLSGTKAGEVRSELLQTGSQAIVKAAAIGVIDKTGKVPSWINDPKYSPYVNGPELQQFEKQAQVQARVDALTQKQTELANRQLNERKAESSANNLLTNNVKIDSANGRPMVGPDWFKGALEIAKMPDAPQGLARTLIDWGEKQQNGETKVIQDDAATRQQLTDRLFDPANPTTRQDLMKAQVQGKLSDHSFQSMERLVTELETAPLKSEIWKTTIAAVKDRLIISGGIFQGKDAAGAASYASFMSDFLPQYLQKSRTGTLPPNALNIRDPNSMISQSMEPYKRSALDRINDTIAMIDASGAPTVSEPVPQAAPGAKVKVPPALSGIAPLLYHSETKQFSNPDTGAVYDIAGKLQVPATADRIAGSIYETPKGKMRWTGTGWQAQ